MATIGIKHFCQWLRGEGQRVTMGTGDEDRGRTEGPPPSTKRLMKEKREKKGWECECVCVAY